MTKPANPKNQKPIEYITPPNMLRAKLITDSATVRDPLREAEKALKSMASETATWVDDEIERLHKCRNAFMKAPSDPATLSALGCAAMDVKGLAGLTGNLAADKFVTSLIALVTDPSGCAAKEPGLVAAHVDAIRATRESTHNQAVADALATELAGITAASLRAATAKSGSPKA